MSIYDGKSSRKRQTFAFIFSLLSQHLSTEADRRRIDVRYAGHRSSSRHLRFRRRLGTPRVELTRGRRVLAGADAQLVAGSRTKARARTQQLQQQCVLEVEQVVVQRMPRLAGSKPRRSLAQVFRAQLVSGDSPAGSDFETRFLDLGH